MFETMLREMLLKMIREDPEFRDQLTLLVGSVYDNSVSMAVKHVINSNYENQGPISIKSQVVHVIEHNQQVQDAIRDLVVNVICEDSSCADYINDQMKDYIDNLTFEVNVR